MHSKQVTQPRLVTTARAMDHTPRHLLPFLAAMAGVAFLSLMDAFMKDAALAAGVYTASLLRSLMAALLVAPLWLASGIVWPRWPVMKLHLERGVVSAMMALSFFYALTKLPIAEAIALSFIAPLVALYFARIFLGEVIGRGAIIASVLGFAGTLVIVAGRLGNSEFDEGAVSGIASLFFSAILYAYNFVVIRRQSQVAGPLEVATFHAGIGGLVQALAAPFFFAMPGGEALGTIAIAAGLTVCGSIAITWAFARAEAQVLVPVEYTGFLWAALFGWLFFREAVTATTIAGVVLIVIGCLIAVPKRRAKMQAQAEDQPGAS